MLPFYAIQRVKAITHSIRSRFAKSDTDTQRAQLWGRGSYKAIAMAQAIKPMPAINPTHSKTRAKVSLAGVVLGTSRRGASSMIAQP